MESALETALQYIQSFDDPYLAALRNKGKPTWGIENVRALLHDLGNPHLSYPTIHVAGTKGKGSTAAFITQGLIEAGYKTGLYVSPHLEQWSERIQINRENISGPALLGLTDGLKRFIDRYPTLSAFEVTSALALWHFGREACDAAVIEVGLGGRLDATSVVEPEVCVITHISYDHMQLLGDTLDEIAGEKAAIIKPGVPTVSAHQEDEAALVIEERARQQKSPLAGVGREWKYAIDDTGWESTAFTLRHEDGTWHARTQLLGTFQPANATLAAAALCEADKRGLAVPMQAILHGIEKTRWPGRMEVLQKEPRVIIDSAHNTQSMQMLVQSLKELNTDGDLHVIFGCMADKDVAGMLAALLPSVKSVIFTRVDNPRAAEPTALRDLTLATHPVQESAIAPTVAEALVNIRPRLMPTDTLCVCGSLSIAGQARTILRQAEATGESPSEG